ncbi:MAG TPA: ABC transporter permease subunit [Dongiaceae bacterium]|nr:ABC transporter permease subunit [Dongiaceae bacterium]
MLDRLFAKAWGEATAFLDRRPRIKLVDLFILAGIAGLVFALRGVAREWTGVLRPEVVIDLSPRALPKYTLFSLTRGLAAYALSLGFTLVYGYWAARDKLAERVLIPLLDVLQSIPILGFMPGLVLTLVGLFPTSNVGLELAAVIMMFTGQVWNMTFSFYYSLRSIPQDLREVATVYRYDWWERFRWMELPFSTLGLVWNSMMSMAGGWFFLMINEAFVLGKRDFRLPGIGSYMSVAVARGDKAAMAWAFLAMVVMIVTLDQFLWRPVVAWAQKFRVEEGGEVEANTSWFLDWLRRSRLARWVRWKFEHMVPRRRPAPPEPEPETGAPRRPVDSALLSRIVFGVLVLVLLVGLWQLVDLLRHVKLASWGASLGLAFITLGRVIVSTVLGTLWTLPVGLAIGLTPSLSRRLQPVVQVAASFPAPMLFPIVIAALAYAGVPLGWGSILLMLLGTQWYVLFNVIAGAMAVPADLKEAARSYRITGWARLTKVLIPAVFPYLVTGWVTAAGGAWNASIVSEYVTFKGRVMTAPGIGSQISLAAERGDLPGLAASVLIMSTLVVLFNRNVWRRLYHLAETRYALNR